MFAHPLFLAYEERLAGRHEEGLLEGLRAVHS